MEKNYGLQVEIYYRLKISPNYGYVKILEFLNTSPKSARCEHTVDKNDKFGFIRTFNLREILNNKKD